MDVASTSFTTGQKPFHQAGTDSTCRNKMCDLLDRSTEGKTSMLDVTNALCLPVLNVKISRFISKVSLKHFEEAATVLYNNPFSWCFWLNPIHIDIDLSEYMELYSSKNMILNFIIETCARRSSFVCDRDVLIYKYSLLPYKTATLLSQVFDGAIHFSAEFESLSLLLFQSSKANDFSCDWRALAESFLEIPALVDEERWREIASSISSSLEELSLGLSQNVTAILQFLGSLFQQVLISRKHPRSFIEWIVAFSLEIYRHIFDHEILFEEHKIRVMIKATISLCLMPFSFIETDARVIPSQYPKIPLGGGSDEK